jgi:signal transduction histidine kinase
MIPYFFFILNSIEFFVGLFALCRGYSILGVICLFLLALNLIFGQLCLLRSGTPAPAAEDETEAPTMPPAELSEQISELSRSNAALKELNHSLSEQVAACEKQLRSAPVLYHCPLTSAAPVSLSKLLRAYYDQHMTDFLRFGLQSSLRMEGGSFETLLSRSAFTLICDNLLDNTLKYTPRHGIVVITLSRQGEDTLLIWKNSGNGIPQEDTQKVFDLNFHINQTGSGTGFGLTQTRTIIRDLGGSIWAKSSPESGFAVYIQIPAGQKGATK